MLLQAETHPSYVADVIPSDPDLESLEDLAEHAGVELVTWPADEHRRQSLARAGVPRLLLVSPDAEAPAALGLDEDWVRLPADEGDVVARLQRLGRVLEQLQHDHPVIDANHIVHFGGTSVLLSPAQAALVTALLEHPGHVVERGRLEATVWPEGAPGPEGVGRRGVPTAPSAAGTGPRDPQRPGARVRARRERRQGLTPRHRPRSSTSDDDA